MTVPTGAAGPAGLISPRLRAGDRVRFVSPASRPEREHVTRGAEILSGWGLDVEIASHAFDSFGHYLAGRDEDRLGDLNDALRDPGVRAIVATTGGKGAYRIAGGLDFAAARRDPKPLVGFSDITILHLVLWQRCRLIGLLGPHAAWQDWYGSQAADALRRALMQPEPVTVHQDPGELTAKVLIEGRSSGILMGGNLDTIGRSVGWACPSFDGAILLIEDVDKYIGAMDRTLTQLLECGCLDGVRGVAVGQFIRSADQRPGKWSIVDLLYDRLGLLGVPVLGGLPIGHGAHPPTIPLGATATLDTNTRTLTIEPGVQ
ncbi:MAG: Muramoyltetrapeptide carboxypeptidase [uncultured Solirubrobacteraceae bacterium]|uniref:Muramoyltetrapeptide carboxypeptidase n=1 Tax=uncultured Solirubrobacteraceae bacterium TaxID=1162706 RepID=A0A6J4SEW6_9ACTN|nr:MAG: Muramoyltetrapeptide carboxypeptidase [uncultured Solirubrobacteraceae bacterium]